MEQSLASKIRSANSALIADGRTDAVGEFFTSDYVVHLTDRDLGGGHDAVRRFLHMLLDAFADVEVEVDVFLEGGDRIAWQRTIRATHRGDFMGFPPSGERIVWRDMMTSRFQDGFIAEEWAISDLAERLLLARKH